MHYKAGCPVVAKVFSRYLPFIFLLMGCVHGEDAKGLAEHSVGGRLGVFETHTGTYDTEYGYVHIHSAYTVHGNGDTTQHPMVVLAPMRVKEASPFGLRGWREGMGTYVITVDDLGLQGNKGQVLLYSHKTKALKIVSGSQWSMRDIATDDAASEFLNALLDEHLESLMALDEVPASRSMEEDSGGSFVE